jgi:hypothetical protein
MQVKEGSRAPRDILKALSKMGNLAKVIAGRSSGKKLGQPLQALQLKKAAPFSCKLAHNK